MASSKGSGTAIKQVTNNISNNDGAQDGRKQSRGRRFNPAKDVVLLDEPVGLASDEPLTLLPVVGFGPAMEEAIRKKQAEDPLRAAVLAVDAADKEKAARLTRQRTAARSQALFDNPGVNATASQGPRFARGRRPKTNLIPNEAVDGNVTEADIPIKHTQAISVSSNSDRLTIPDNVLLPYVSLQYHMVWSMVPTGNLPKIQQNIPVGAGGGDAETFADLQRDILAEGSVPFASTGDVFRFEREPDHFDPSSTDPRLIVGDIPWAPAKGRHYYNIESLEMDNVMAPTAQNPYINSMITGRIKIIEPHGFKWNEDARRVANDNGYSGISLGRVVWRLDIFYSGYNQDTGEWIPFVELNTRVKRTKLITYYMNITTVDAKVTNTGTAYDMSIVPSGHSAYRPEEVVLDAGAIFTGSQSQTQTFGGFLERVSQSMNKAVSDRTNQQVVRNYEFKAPPELLSAEFFAGEFAGKKGFISKDPNSGSFVSQGRDANVITLLEDALKDLELTWNNILKKDDPKHLKPRIHWGIRFNVIYGSGVNVGTNDFAGITNQYIIEPFITYKHATINNRDEMAKVVEVNAQADRVKEMIRLGMINRIYNYINTSENNEVIEVDIALKNFYYHTMFTGTANSSLISGQPGSSGTTTTEITKKADTTEKQGTGSTDQGEALEPSHQENSVESSLRRLFGSSIDNPSATCSARVFKTAYDTYGGGFGEMPQTDASGSTGGENIMKRAEYQANINDHIKNDMIRIDLEVRGDPIWLLSPYGKDSGNLLALGDQTTDLTATTALVQTQSARCFFLRMFAPHQDDYMNPNRDEASSSCSILGGFYEVIKVTSVFSGGKFTQTLNAAKMNHLNYIENNISLATDSQVVGEDISTENTSPAGAKPPKPEPVEPVSEPYVRLRDRVERGTFG